MDKNEISKMVIQGMTEHALLHRRKPAMMREKDSLRRLVCWLKEIGMCL